MRTLKDTRIGIIGLGYVGLPLAVEFGKRYPTVGFDIKAGRIAELQSGKDSTLETTSGELASAEHLTCTTDKSELAKCNTFIVTVPTPVGKNNRPVLTPLKGASETVGSVLKKGDVVVYESTVYPGCTEEYCVPILESESGLKFNKDFFAGYSPERINPGDKEHRLPTIKKVTSGSTPEVADYRRCSIRQHHHRGHAQGVEPQGRRSSEGDREHSARRQHRADQRAGADLQPARHRHRRGAQSRRHQVEFPELQARARRRALHRRRSLLLDAQGAGDRLSARDDPGRAAAQRQHGRLRGAAA